MSLTTGEFVAADQLWNRLWNPRRGAGARSGVAWRSDQTFMSATE